MSVGESGYSDSKAGKCFSSESCALNDEGPRGDGIDGGEGDGAIFSFVHAIKESYHSEYAYRLAILSVMRSIVVTSLSY